MVRDRGIGARLALVMAIFGAPLEANHVAAQQTVDSRNAQLPDGANTRDPVRPFYLDLTGLDFRTAPPTHDPANPSYPDAVTLPDRTLPTKAQTGNFVIGPSHPASPETIERPGVPRGHVLQFTVSSSGGTIFTPGMVRAENAVDADLDAARTVPGDPSNLILTSSRPASWTRSVRVYLPARLANRRSVPFMVVSDTDWAFDGGRLIITVLDNLIAERRLPPIAAILIDAGGQDAQGSERGRELDTLSGAYAEWIETEILPKVERRARITLTRDPSARATIGASSSGAAAFTMAWFRPDLYRRVIAFSPTFTNQQWPHNPALPGGAWQYHSVWPGPGQRNLAPRGFDQPVAADTPPGVPLIPNAPRKPIRFWFNVGDRDMFYPHRIMPDGMHDWVLASERMATALAAKRYHYQFLFTRNAGHVDRPTIAQTLPAALEWVWSGYPQPVR